MGELFRLKNFKACMYYGDTDKHKEPHFHVYTTNGESATISIATGDVLAGNIDKKTLKTIKSILNKDKDAFWDRWNKAVSFNLFSKIDIK